MPSRTVLAARAMSGGCRGDVAPPARGRATGPADRTSHRARPRRCTGMTVPRSPDAAYAASARRDRAMDGQFVLAVVTTGIYCTPSGPARRPKRGNARFYLTAAAAEADGYRACKRCKPT
jgi:methylphosphotriester-DNA--protein-cysteine methyltransferase